MTWARTSFVFPPVLRVQLGGHEIPVQLLVRTVIVSVSVGNGCFNDTAEDRLLWRAQYHGRVAEAETPEAAARAVLIE